MPDPVDTSRLWRSSFCIYSRPAPCSSFSTNLRFAVDLHLPQHNSISTSHPYLSHPQRQYYLYTFMSTGERSTSRGRALVRGLYLPLSGYSSSHDHINRYRPSSSCRHHSALPNSNPLAPSPGPDDYSDTRGRDLIPSRDPDMVNALFFSVTAS